MITSLEDVTDAEEFQAYLDWVTIEFAGLYSARQRGRSPLGEDADKERGAAGRRQHRAVA
jgi:hypothetical protein